MEGGDISMSSVDSRVVEMKFNNTQFEAGIQKTLSSLESLKKGLKLEGASKGLSDISSASKGFSLAHIASGLDGLSAKFSALGIIGITALTNIANKAVNVGLTMIKSMTVDPIKQGLDEYETTLNSIQTILANTSQSGGNLTNVNAALAELNTYSDKTIYNFSEMARNIGTFTAAGVKLGPATAAIKGIANLAAVSGSNSQQASTAMYQLSQAMATGTVKLMDWNSVVNAGMGGAVFQNNLKETARAHGVNVDAIIKKEGSFRDSLSKGWLTSAILTESLSKFTGDLSAAQLKQMGYTDKQIPGIMKMAQTAQDAATKVKTFSQLTGTLKEAAGSGWAQTWQLIFGDFEQAKTMWTNVNNVLSGMIGASAKARNAVIGDWSKLGGRDLGIDAIKIAFNDLMAAVKPIKDAFRAIFPPATGKQLYDITEAIHHFVEGLKMGSDTAFKVQRIFQGLFSILDIGWMVIKQGINFFMRLFGAVTTGSGGFLTTLAKIGDWFNNLRYAIKNGEGLEKFFTRIGDPIVVVISLLKEFASFVGRAFSGLGNVDTSGLDKLKSRFEPLGAIGNVIISIWSRVGSFLKSAWTAFAPIADAFSGFFANVGKTVQDGMGNINYSSILDSINTGLFAGLLLLIKKFLKGGVSVDFGGGMLSSIKDAFGGLTDTMKAMQTNLKAGALMKIAIAIALLTVSVVALSMIDSGKLTVALTAVTFMMTQLLAAMFMFTKVAGLKGVVKMPIIAASMILLAIAIDVLSIAVTRLAKLSWQELAKGLVGVTVLIGGLVIAANSMKGGAKNMISTGAGLVVMAVAIKILVSAVKDLSGLGWDALGKGLVGVGMLLGSLALFTKFSETNKGGLAQGAGLILLAVAIKIMASAVATFAAMSWGDIGKGLVAMAGGLTLMAAALILIPPSSILSAVAILIVASSLSMIGVALAQMGALDWSTIGKGLTSLAGALTLIALALILIPPSSLLSAAAVFVVAASLGMIASALSSMGGMSWEEIGKGLVTLAGALTIIAVAMFAMTGAIPGALALIIVAGSLAIIAPILLQFGQMSWEAIGKGLLMLAGVFVILAAAGFLLTPVIPTLLGLGIAITLMGVGMLAAGAGLLLFSVGLTALSVAGAAGTVAIVGIVSGLIGLIPMLMTQIGLGVVAFAKVIAMSGPAITGAITTVLLALITAINTLAPRIVSTLLRLIFLLVGALLAAVPRLVSAGMQLIVGILTGIANKIGAVVTAAVSIITGFIGGISRNIGRIIESGVQLILSFIRGLTSAINAHSAELGVAGGNLAKAIVSGMARGIAGGLGVVVNAAKNLASSALNAAKSALGIKSPSKEFAKLGVFTTQGFAKGVVGSLSNVKASLALMGSLIKTTVASTQKDVTAAAKKLATLKAAKHPNKGAIAAATKSLKQSQLLHTQAIHADTAFTKWLTTQKAGLTKLGTNYDIVTEKLKNAKVALVDAQKLKDDFAKSTKEKFNVLPDIDPKTSVLSYENSIKRETAANNKFREALANLRKMGMDDTTYNKLLAEGVSVQPFLDKLINGGPQGVKDLNALNADLAASATSLGNQAATDLYQAGVNAAQGLVNGLAASQALIVKQMNTLAAAMVASIKRQLGIRSPSRVFMEVGKYSNEGLAKGLDQYSGVVEKSAAGVGSTAIDAMRKSISGMSSLIAADIDMTPVIRPVLDLTSMQKDALKIDALLNTKPISVDTAYSTAKDASAGYQSNQAALAQQTTASASAQDNLTFIQNNSSPKALSSAEIYRQTKNQLSVAKGALTK